MPEATSHEIPTFKVDEDYKMILPALDEAKSPSGKARISRRYLQDLATGSEDDVAETVARIFTGTYQRNVRRMPTLSEGGIPGGYDFSEMRQMESDVKRITDALNSEFRSLSRNGDAEALRSAMRSYIEMLEDILRQI
jgi:hypothetical protein